MMFTFVKAMAAVAKDEAPTQDCGCGCGPVKKPSVPSPSSEEDCPCCGSIVRSDNQAVAAGCGCGPGKSSIPNGVPSCEPCNTEKDAGCGNANADPASGNSGCSSCR